MNLLPYEMTVCVCCREDLRSVDVRAGERECGDCAIGEHTSRCPDYVHYYDYYDDEEELRE